MRISAGPVAALLVLGVACGGAQRGRDACADYAAAMRAPLRRLEKAADAFAAAPMAGPDDGARASRALAARLDEVRSDLGAVRPGRADLRDAHARLVGSLGEMSRSLGFLAQVLAARDEPRREEARAALRRASEGYGAATQRVRAACPGTPM